MKRLLSLLVVIAMVVSMIPNVFAAQEEVDFDELTGRLVVLEDIATIEVVLAEGSDGMIYQWTPDANYNLSLSYTAPEGTEIAVTVTQGEASAAAVDGAVSMDVWADQVVEIEVSEAAALAAEFTITGEASAVPGSDENNGIFLSKMENTVTAAGTTFSGSTTWYQGYFSGTVMTITGTGDYNVTYNGETIAAVDGIVSTAVAALTPRYPVIFAIDTVGEYTIKFEYPLGSYSNPAQLVIGENTASIEAGSQGYYYNWTAEAAGTLTITMPSDMDWSYAINNMTSYTYGDTQWSDSDPVVNPAEIEVAAGDEIQIIVNTYDPADMWNIPAGDLTFTAAFAEPTASLEITSQTEKVIAFDSETVEFNVEAQGDGLTYQWYYQAAGATDWTKLGAASAKTANYSFTALATTHHGRNYKCVITDATGATVETASIPMIIRMITAQPVSANAKPGETAQFTVEYAAGEALEGITYQWEIKEPNGAWKTTWSSGAKTATLNFTATGLNNGYTFRCTVTDGDKTFTTNELSRLWVNADAAVITNQTSGTYNVVSGYYAYLSVEATGDGATYQWQCSMDGGESWYNTASSNTAKTANFQLIGYDYRSGYQYRCVISTPNGSGFNYTTSDPAILNVLPAASFTVQPIDSEEYEGGNVVFSVAADPTVEPTSQGLRYQWQKQKPGTTWWTNCTFDGAQTADMTVPAEAKWDGYTFRCKIINEQHEISGYGYVVSDYATLTVMEVAE